MPIDQSIPPRTWVRLPRDRWPDIPTFNRHLPQQVYVSGEFAVQIYAAESPAECRLCVYRHDKRDGITWDALQSIKNELGFADRDAVEIYPAAEDLVNVANMRHLWVMAERVSFAWRADGIGDGSQLAAELVKHL